MIKARPSHMGVLAFVVTFGVLSFVLHSDCPTADAALYFQHTCGVEFDCWATIPCFPGALSRTLSFPVAYCQPTGDPSHYCMTLTWVCFDIFSCPDGRHLGATYEPDTCAHVSL
ncbi:MAG TPA: hypothetical protein PLO37_19890 [Candidatus Hydrogenedentes bacterium]|nr:hypothetical protein [Candidatus Hydrogenedentota bacterium]HPG69117.1 hypothetical protein [Candidatus Hydrogenedentota bacterium]